jgi:hypothetical protein
VWLIPQKEMVKEYQKMGFTQLIRIKELGNIGELMTTI